MPLRALSHHITSLTLLQSETKFITTLVLHNTILRTKGIAMIVNTAIDNFMSAPCVCVCETDTLLFIDLFYSLIAGKFTGS